MSAESPVDRLHPAVCRKLPAAPASAAADSQAGMPGRDDKTHKVRKKSLYSDIFLIEFFGCKITPPALRGQYLESRFFKGANTRLYMPWRYEKITDSEYCADAAFAVNLQAKKHREK